MKIRHDGVQVQHRVRRMRGGGGGRRLIFCKRPSQEVLEIDAAAAAGSVVVERGEIDVFPNFFHGFIGR
nr:hypothetical protein Itr_chr11CG03240 [Ipomoea trifida]